MHFLIERNVPLPTPRTRNRYPFAEMAVGDSIFVDGGSTSRPGTPGYRVRSAAWYYGKKNNKKFTARNVNGGVRIWRVE